MSMSRLTEEEAERQARITEAGLDTPAAARPKHMIERLDMDINEAASMTDITDMYEIARSSTKADIPRIKLLAREVIRRQPGGMLELKNYSKGIEEVLSLIPGAKGKKGIKLDLKTPASILKMRQDTRLSKIKADRADRRGKGKGTSPKMVQKYAKEIKRGEQTMLTAKSVEEIAKMLIESDPNITKADARSTAFGLNKKSERAIIKHYGGPKRYRAKLQAFGRQSTTDDAAASRDARAAAAVVAKTAKSQLVESRRRGDINAAASLLTSLDSQLNRHARNKPTMPPAIPALGKNATLPEITARKSNVKARDKKVTAYERKVIAHTRRGQTLRDSRRKAEAELRRSKTPTSTETVTF